MSLNDLPDLTADESEVRSSEAVISDDVLVKVFALGPGGQLSLHEHPDCTNVFHVLAGTVTVLQGEREEQITAPGIIHNARGVPHGARNDTDDQVLLSASLCPMPN